MKYTKKWLVVPYENHTNINNSKETVTNKNIDEELTDVLNDKLKSTSEKIKLYNQIITKYLSKKDENNKPINDNKEETQKLDDKSENKLFIRKVIKKRKLNKSIVDHNKSFFFPPSKIIRKEKGNRKLKFKDVNIFNKTKQSENNLDKQNDFNIYDDTIPQDRRLSPAQLKEWSAIINQNDKKGNEKSTRKLTFKDDTTDNILTNYILNNTQQLENYLEKQNEMDISMQQSDETIPLKQWSQYRSPKNKDD